MNIRAVIFDFDGTLADTLPVCFYAFRRIFEEYDNREISDIEIVSMFGPSETGIIRQNLRNLQLIEEAIQKYYIYYEEIHTTLVEKNTDIHELLCQLKSKDIKLGIVTGKAKKSLDISMEILEMNEMFDVIITGDDVDKPKPHSEGVLKAISSLGLNKKEVIFVGDSNADIMAGKDAGIITIGVHWLQSVQSLNFEPAPDFLCKSTVEFESIMK